MKSPPAVLIALLSVLLASCGSGTESTAVDTVAEAKEIARLESGWSAMYGEKDLDGITNLLARDSVLIMPGAKPVVGVDSIRKATQAMLATDDKVSWKSDHAVVAPGGGMAYDYGSATTVLADGTVIEGSYLVVWVREGGRWKVAADMFN